jgi:hypothetical protein
MAKPQKRETINLDSNTRKWFDRIPLPERLAIQTTVTQCDDCGLYYKPSLGHRCKKSGKS